MVSQKPQRYLLQRFAEVSTASSLRPCFCLALLQVVCTPAAVAMYVLVRSPSDWDLTMNELELRAAGEISMSTHDASGGAARAHRSAQLPLQAQRIIASAALATNQASMEAWLRLRRVSRSWRAWLAGDHPAIGSVGPMYCSIRQHI